MKNGTIAYRVGRLEKTVNKIAVNDLPHIQMSLTQVKTDVAWLKRSYWLVAGASVGALFTGIMGLL